MQFFSVMNHCVRSNIKINIFIEKTLRLFSMLKLCWTLKAIKRHVSIQQHVQERVILQNTSKPLRKWRKIYQISQKHGTNFCVSENFMSFKKTFFLLHSRECRIDFMLLHIKVSPCSPWDSKDDDAPIRFTRRVYSNIHLPGSIHST